MRGTSAAVTGVTFSNCNKFSSYMRSVTWRCSSKSWWTWVHVSNYARS